MVSGGDIELLRERTLRRLVYIGDFPTLTFQAFVQCQRALEDEAQVDSEIDYPKDEEQVEKRLFQVPLTGTKKGARDFLDRLGHYRENYLYELAFIHTSHIFEYFLTDFLKLLLTWQPDRMLGNKKDQRKAELKKILETGSQDEIIVIVDRKVRDLCYGNIRGLFSYVIECFELDGPNEEDVRKIVEIRARRDAIVHNGGILGEDYVRKARGFAQGEVGEPAVVETPYWRDSWTLQRNITVALSDSAIRLLSAS